MIFVLAALMFSWSSAIAIWSWRGEQARLQQSYSSIGLEQYTTSSADETAKMVHAVLRGGASYASTSSNSNDSVTKRDGGLNDTAAAHDAQKSDHGTGTHVEL